MGISCCSLLFRGLTLTFGFLSSELQQCLTVGCVFACACNRAEQRGVAEAAALLALLDPSCEVAAREMHASAEAGDPVACFMLAQAYFEGLHGCEK